MNSLVASMASSPAQLSQSVWPIVIHSKGRAGQSRLISQLLADGVSDLWIFVEPQDEQSYRESYPSAQLVVIDANNQGLYYVQEKERQFALDRGWLWFWMCDDDAIRFSRRDNGKSSKTTALEAMIFSQGLAGDDVGMVGMSRSSSNFPGGKEVLENKGVEWMRGLSREACQVAQFRLRLCVDIDFALQVLQAGLRTRRTSLRDVTLPPDGSNKGGLFETYKQKGIREQAYNKLAELWPSIVSVKDGKLRRTWAMAFKPKSSTPSIRAKRDDLCVFILTHGRPERVLTVTSLARHGYTGEWYLVCGDDDEALPAYQEKYGSKVIVFNKQQVEQTFDVVDNFKNRKSVVYARNMCFSLAKNLGFKFFIQLDDDYDQFVHKFDADGHFKSRPIRDMDAVFGLMVDFYQNAPQIKSFAMAQDGDYMGGSKSTQAVAPTLLRKCMQTFICSPDRPFTFKGTMNDDVNTYCNEGGKGALFLTATQVAIHQGQTQLNKGGLTDLYVSYGTYVKSFYSVILNPASVKVSQMGVRHKRLHHRIDWDRTVPKIVRESLVKS